MSNIPSELKYASSHEWVRNEGDGTFTVGISEHESELENLLDAEGYANTIDED